MIVHRFWLAAVLGSLVVAVSVEAGGQRRKRKDPPLPHCGVPICTSVTADRTRVLAGDRVRLMANAGEPSGLVLIYDWSTTGGTVEGRGPEVELLTDGLAPGDYVVTARVDDGFGHRVECSTKITVADPNEPRLSADKYMVTSGEVVILTAWKPETAISQDRVEYEWWTSDGAVRSEGHTAWLDTTGVSGGTVQVSVTVSAGTFTKTEAVSIVVEVTLPGCHKAVPRLFFSENSLDFSEEAFAILDGAALRLAQDPRLRIVVDGHQTKAEKRLTDRKRAWEVWTYLQQDKGISNDRIVVRTFGDECSTGDPKMDARVELYLLPEGREVSEIEKNCVGGTVP